MPKHYVIKLIVMKYHNNYSHLVLNNFHSLNKLPTGFEGHSISIAGIQGEKE